MTSFQYLGGGGTNGHFIDPHQGTRVLPAVPFSPVPQTMIECSPYRDGYQLGNQIVYPHPQSTGYGMLGPTTLVSSRQVIGTMQQPTPRRQGEASLFILIFLYSLELTLIKLEVKLSILE